MTLNTANDLFSPDFLTRLAERRASGLAHLPSAAAINAAIDELRITAQRGVDTAETKEERRFFTNQRNAFVNCEADRAAGRTARPLGNGYAVESSRTPGKFYRLSVDGGIWRCSCEAGDRGTFCRHAAQITAIEVADVYERMDLVADAPHADDPDDFADLLANPERYGADEPFDLI